MNVFAQTAKKNIVLEDWEPSNDWYEQKSDSITCPLCNVAADIHQFKFSPELGFSDLGFTFWNYYLPIFDLTRKRLPINSTFAIGRGGSFANFQFLLHKHLCD